MSDDDKAARKDGAQTPGYYGKRANTDQPSHARLKRFYTPQPVAVTRQDYDDWAEDYDKNTVLDSGYCAPDTVAALVRRYVPDTATRVVELGCGTGLLGQALKPDGYAALEGWDLSPGMLAKARATRGYASLNEIDLTQPLPFADASCAVMVSVGVYGPGVVGPEHIELLVPPLAHGGLGIHSINGLSWRKRPFEAAIQALVEAGKIAIVEQNWGPYIRTENIDGVYIVMRRTA